MAEKYWILINPSLMKIKQFIADPPPLIPLPNMTCPPTGGFGGEKRGWVIIKD
jgi:hypothetical protein